MFIPLHFNYKIKKKKSKIKTICISIQNSFSLGCSKSHKGLLKPIFSVYCLGLLKANGNKCFNTGCIKQRRQQLLALVKKNT